MKINRAAKSFIANQENVKPETKLSTSGTGKENRDDELNKAYKELALQYDDKEKREAELVIANEEKAERAAELIMANVLKAKLLPAIF